MKLFFKSILKRRAWCTFIMSRHTSERQQHILIAAEVREAEELLGPTAAAPQRLCWNPATSPCLWIPFQAYLQELVANSIQYWAHAAAPCAVPAAPALLPEAVPFLLPCSLLLGYCLCEREKQPRLQWGCACAKPLLPAAGKISG